METLTLFSAFQQVTMLKEGAFVNYVTKREGPYATQFIRYSRLSNKLSWRIMARLGKEIDFTIPFCARCANRYVPDLGCACKQGPRPVKYFDAWK